MPTTATFAQVVDRMSTILSVPLEKLTPGTVLADLALDSFRLVETIVDLQEEFNATFTREALDQIGTLGELAELLESGR